MNIKSLLLGSAAALAVVSGAHAADAIVAAEPEPMEYVKVCDAFGAGYFYIPGTETCLKIGGYVRLEEQFTFWGDGDTNDVNGYARGYVKVLTAADTEMGVLKTNISFYGEANGTSNDGYVLDRAYIELGGFGMGYTTNPFDDGIAGETDNLGNDTVNFRTYYNFNAGSFAGNIGVDQFGLIGEVAGVDQDGWGISGKAGATFGAVTATLYGGYDFDTSEFAVEAMLAAAIGPGTLNVAGAYQTGSTHYFLGNFGNYGSSSPFSGPSAGEAWAIAASYEAKITDKLTLTPGVQYTKYDDLDADIWDAGALLAYTVTDGLTASLSVQYHDLNTPVGDTNYVDGWFRLQRDF